MPRVSVVMPAYNRAQLIAESIQSVLDQTFTDFELIVVDDGSTDNTKEVVGNLKDPRIRYIFQANRGVAAARNTGIGVSDGACLAFLDSDDFWLPYNLELKVKTLDSRPDIALVCSDAYLFDDQTGAALGRLWDGKTYKHLVNPRKATEQPLREMLAHGCFIMPQTTMVRRLVFDEVGYFDESLQSGEDWDMFVRIVRRFSIETMETPLARIRRHDDSLSGSWDKWYRADVAIANKAIRSYSLSRGDLEVVKNRLARHHFLYGRNAVLSGRIATGREALLASVKINPWGRWGFRSCLYLTLSLPGSRGVLVIKSWKKCLERMIKAHRMSKAREGENQCPG